MKIEITERLRIILIVFTTLIIIIGLILSIFQYHYGNSIVLLGFILQTIFDSAEIYRLRKIIKKYEDKG